MPGEKLVPDEKWFDNRDQNEGDQNEGSQSANSGAQSRAQSSQDVWINSDDVNKGTQTESGSSKYTQIPNTVEVKIEDTEVENNRSVPKINSAEENRTVDQEYVFGERRQNDCVI